MMTCKEQLQLHQHLFLYICRHDQGPQVRSEPGVGGLQGPVQWPVCQVRQGKKYHLTHLYRYIYIDVFICSPIDTLKPNPSGYKKTLCSAAGLKSHVTFLERGRPTNKAGS